MVGVKSPYHSQSGLAGSFIRLLLTVTSALPVIRAGGNFHARFGGGCQQGSLLECRRPVRQQSDGGGPRVVGGLDYELFTVGTDVVTDPHNVWQVEME
jgi:hypothetical protein